MSWNCQARSGGTFSLTRCRLGPACLRREAGDEVQSSVAEVRRQNITNVGGDVIDTSVRPSNQPSAELGGGRVVLDSGDTEPLLWKCGVFSFPPPVCFRLAWQLLVKSVKLVSDACWTDLPPQPSFSPPVFEADKQRAVLEGSLSHTHSGSRRLSTHTGPRARARSHMHTRSQIWRGWTHTEVWKPKSIVACCFCNGRLLCVLTERRAY